MSKEPPPGQFSIAKMLLIVVAFALLFAIVSNMRTNHRIVIRCKTLPPNDQALTDWIGEHKGVRDVSVSRGEGSVVASFTGSMPMFGLSKIPLEELGYEGLIGMDFTTRGPTLWDGFKSLAGAVPSWAWGLFLIGAISIGIALRWRSQRLRIAK
jgi:hypothetical protein